MGNLAFDSAGTTWLACCDLQSSGSECVSSTTCTARLSVFATTRCCVHVAPTATKPKSTTLGPSTSLDSSSALSSRASAALSTSLVGCAGWIGMSARSALGMLRCITGAGSASPPTSHRGSTAPCSRGSCGASPLRVSRPRLTSSSATKRLSAACAFAARLVEMRASYCARCAAAAAISSLDIE
eukprot:364338-Chlamydomonas_euryale.AAC.4